MRRALLAGVAGFAGMVLESALILDYQTASGVLFQDLGLLLTMFMGGLAAGAAVVDRWVGSGQATRVMGVGLMIALAAQGLLLSVALHLGAGEGLVMASVMLLACGFFVAALFAYASLHERPDQRAMVSPLYASDLLGGVSARWPPPCCSSRRRVWRLRVVGRGRRYARPTLDLRIIGKSSLSSEPQLPHVRIDGALLWEQFSR